jgi:ATP-dependent helicase/nuclease subunit A
VNPSPVDQAARDSVRTDHGSTLFVEAGAGTGKTTALVARVVDMVATGFLPSISGLAAITFTENAAAELRSRIREGLEDGHSDTSPYSAAERSRCADGLAALDDAVISTLHGWASRILSEAPLEAGLPPTFAVAAEAGAQEIPEEEWQDFLTELLADDDLHDHVVAALTLGMTLRQLREVAAGLAQSWELLRPRPLSERGLPTITLDQVRSELSDVVGRRDEWPAADKLSAYLEDVRRNLHVVPDDPWEVLRALTVEIKPGSRGTAMNWSRGLTKAAVVEALKSAEGARRQIVGDIADAVVETIGARLQDWLLVQAERRRTTGSLGYHDLLVLARDVLRDHRSVRERLHRLWPVLLIDEFQDTDPLQVEIACLIAGDVGNEVPEHWHDIPISAGRLFFVGDAKQSIYRFRRADIGLFSAVGLRHGTGRTGLTVNFRSVPGILAAANHAFTQLIGADPGAGIPYDALHPHRTATAPDEVPVRLLGGPQPGTNAGELRRLEAQHIADLCVRAKSQGWTVGAPGRPAEFQDMAVLVPTRAILPALEDAFTSRGVPYRIESRSLVWSTDAVRSLVTLLQAVNDPSDEVALLAALRHPALGCSDVDLLGWRAAGGRWSYLAPSPDTIPADHPVARALADLRGWHDERWWIPVNELIARIVRELRLVELTAAQSRPRDHWRRLRFVVDQARAWCDNGGSGLSGFVSWATAQIENDVDLLETVVPEPDDDAVRILTVHGSKGLEFPITIVAGLQSTQRKNQVVIWDGRGRPVIRLKATLLEMAGWPDAVTTDSAQAAAEANRLLYVALTRAQDHLVIGCYHDAQGRTKESPAARLYGLLHDSRFAAVDEAAEVPAAPSPAENWPTVVLGRGEFSAQRGDLLSGVTARVATSATALARAAGPEPRKETDPAVAVDEGLGVPVARPVRRGGRGAAIGTAVHRVLELVDLRGAPTEEVRRLAVHACAQQGVPDLVDDVVDCIHNVLAAPVVAESTRGWREVFVVAERDGRMVEGYVDLLAETTAGELVVVDHKTDSVRSSDDIAAKERAYAPQLTAYADVVESVLGRRPSTSLVFARDRGGQRAADGQQ